MTVTVGMPANHFRAQNHASYGSGESIYSIGRPGSWLSNARPRGCEAVLPVTLFYETPCYVLPSTLLCPRFFFPVSGLPLSPPARLPVLATKREIDKEISSLLRITFLDSTKIIASIPALLVRLYTDTAAYYTYFPWNPITGNLSEAKNGLRARPLSVSAYAIAPLHFSAISMPRQGEILGWQRAKLLQS